MKGVITEYRVRYLETDAQGVVFNMWYLGYCDEAYADFLEEGGVPYPELLALGYDVQIVNATIDWKASLRPHDLATLVTSCSHVGTTSFTLRTRINRGDEPIATVNLVYVGVATDGSGTLPIPPVLRSVLEASLAEASASP